MTKKAVIIGSGIGGIASAIRLQIKGFQVQVIEKNDFLGGKLAEFTEAGFRFDMGPSLFTMPEFVLELFTLADKEPNDYFTYSKQDEVCRYFWNDGGEFIASSNPIQFAKDGTEYFKDDEKSILKKLNKADFINDTIGSLFLEQSLHKLRNFLNFKTILALLKIPKLGIFSTLHETNVSSFRNEKLIQIFDRYATYNGSNPYQTPGIMQIIPHYEYNVGTYFPTDGMYSIVTSLVKLAKDIGVTFNLDEEVSSIEHNGGKVSGVHTNKAYYSADLVFSNMDVNFTYRKLLKSIPVPEKTLNQERSSSALIFYWGVEGRHSKLGLHNIFFADNYKEEFNAIFKTKTLFEDPTIYIHISSKSKSDDAPEGCENWFVMINTPPRGEIDWIDYEKQARNLIISKLNDRLGIDLEGMIRTEKVLSPEGIETRTASYQGALYGTSSNSKFAAFLRHPNFNRRLKGLYFVGGSVHPGGGIPLCLLSAKIATADV